jgi:dipeptidyl aminopeptidase/acylaminoacyl peptidase
VLDVTSGVDTPEASALLDTTGRVVLELERGDAEALYATGWEPPQRFSVKAADGVTALYGNLFKPHGLDPGRKYAVLDDIYPGPQIGAASVRFLMPGSPAENAHSMAALGFAVVVVDGRGTPLRSKAFQEHCRGEHDSDWVEDHAAAIRQLGETHPWLDVDRVGIYGFSGGGRASARCLFLRPDVFKVAVSAAGNHDDFVYHPTWGEKYHGSPDDTDFVAHSNPPYADRLQGKLLLIHGELDNNVTPYLTMRLVDALMKANKDFDLLLVPNADHLAMPHRAYWLRRRFDYFVQHLMGETPPPYRIEDVPFDAASITERLFGR